MFSFNCWQCTCFHRATDLWGPRAAYLDPWFTKIWSKHCGTARGGSNLFFCLFLSGPDTKKLKIPVFFQTKKYKKIQKNTKKYLKIWVPDKRLISSETGSVYACVPLRNIFSFNFMHLGFLKVLIYELSGAADRRTPDRIYEKVHVLHVLETWKSKQCCKTSLIQITFFLVCLAPRPHLRRQTVLGWKFRFEKLSQ